jgi:hypothetical protein
MHALIAATSDRTQAPPATDGVFFICPPPYALQFPKAIEALRPEAVRLP